MREPIPVGFDEMGEVVSVRLPEKMFLVGAGTGGGKSVSISMLCTTAALDTECRLVPFDGKQVELAFWRSCAKASRALGRIRYAQHLQLRDGGQE